MPSEINKFSISGGGDPLYRFEENKLWWSKLIKLSNDMNKVFDIHTSKPEEMIEIYQFFKYSMNRLVIHSSIERWNPLLYSTLISMGIKIRLNFVVTNELSDYYIDLFNDFCIRNNCQLAYRKLVSNDESIKPLDKVVDKCKHNIHHLIRYVEQKDYNYYLMPDGSVQETFLV